MQLVQLAALAAVARTGSFTAASVELGYTQSAVSQQIAGLEAAVGTRLLLRRPVRLTPAGARLATHAQHVLTRLDVARAELVDGAGEERRVRIAATPLSDLGPVLAAFTPDGSGTWRVEVDTDGRAGVRAALAEGRADVAVIDGITTLNSPIDDGEPGLWTRHTVSERGLVVALPADHPLAGRPGVGLDHLVDGRWIEGTDLPVDPGAVPGVAWTGGRGRPVVGGADPGRVVDLVAAGLGAALLPERVVGARPDVAVVPLDRPAVVHRTETLTLRTADAALAGAVAGLHPTGPGAARERPR